VPAVINAVTGRGAAFAQPGLVGTLLRWALIAACRLAFAGKRTKVIFQNPEDLASFVQRGVVPDARAVLIRGAGVDIDVFRPAPVPDGIPIVVLAARLLWEKGIAEFVEASRQLKRRGVACRFVLVGVPDDENPHAVPKDSLERWQAENLVEWWGLRDDMPRVLQSATLVALPTTYPEGVPKILLEAAACGRPIVAADVPGCREIVEHGGNGLLVPPGDAKALADAINELLEHPESRARMGARGRELAVAEFSAARTIAETLAVYRDLLGESVTPRVAAARA
jgi:glycosyltransferase involved in cell wall biosynthesis